MGVPGVPNNKNHMDDLDPLKKESLLRNPRGFTWDFEDYCKWIYCVCEDDWKLYKIIVIEDGS